MKTFYLEVLLSAGTQPFYYKQVVADHFDVPTRGYYAFYVKGKLVATYPIDKTLIYKIEDKE